MTSFLTAIVLTGLVMTGGEDTSPDEEPPRCEIEETEGGLACVDDEGHRVWENPLLTSSLTLNAPRTPASALTIVEYLKTSDISQKPLEPMASLGASRSGSDFVALPSQ